MPTSEAALYPPGTVVVVPFPYSDRLAEKRRPALVVSGDLVGRAGFVWIAMITSARQTRMEGDQPIADPHAIGLTAQSVVRPLKVTTIELLRIIRKIGTLPPDEAERAFARIRSMIGTPLSL